MERFNGGESYPSSLEGTETLSEALVEMKLDIEQLTKLMEEMANEPTGERLTSEEFERKYPRTSTPYERQRRERWNNL